MCKKYLALYSGLLDGVSDEDIIIRINTVLRVSLILIDIFGLKMDREIGRLRNGREFADDQENNNDLFNKLAPQTHLLECQ